MDRAIVLGSPFLPGLVLDPFLAALRERGLPADGFAPAPPATAEAAADAYIEAARETGATTAIAHSNAGNYVPAVAAGSAVTRVIFLDAIVPPLGGGTWPVVPAEMRGRLTPTAQNGELPPWTNWWPDADVRSLFPDDETFERVDAATPRIPVSYLSSHLSAPRDWSTGLDCSFVAFGSTYADFIDVASRAGWPVQTLPLTHLGMLQHPSTVADAVLSELRA